MIQRTIAALLVVLTCYVTDARAQLVDVTPRESTEDITEALRYFGSIDPSVGAALIAYREGRFERALTTASYGPGYGSETWAAVEVRNTSTDDGRGADQFVMTMDAPLLGGLRVFLVRENGLTENLMEYSAFAPFDPADHAVTRLRTPAFDLTPGEQVTLLAHAQMGPFPTFRMSLYTPDGMDEAAFWWGVGHTAFYAFALSCLLFFFGFQGAMRNAVGIWNAVLFLAFLGLIALVDGLLFRVVYPQRPDLQSAIGFGLLFSLSGAGFLVAGSSLRAVQRGLSGWVSALALLSLLGFLISLAVPGPETAILAYALIGAMLLTQVFGAFAARRDRIMPSVGAVALSGLAVLGAVIVIGLIVTGFGGAWLDAAHALRAVFGFLLLATMTLLTANVMALRKRHLAAVEARVLALEAEAERSRELLAAERNYAKARELAALRQRQLATASHDLKQPLMSLRMTFDTLAADMQPEVKTRLGDAFDYLGSLASGYVDDTLPEEAFEAEAYPLSIPLGTVAQMFADEAAAKGLILRVHPCTLDVTVPPIALMRIVTNLVSNAIKYTDQGRVVVGVRRAGGPSLYVCDTGPGLRQNELVQFSQAYQKGASSTGHGLGLSVCFEMAEAEGMTLDVASRPGRGTCFKLRL